MNMNTSLAFAPILMLAATAFAGTIAQPVGPVLQAADAEIAKIVALPDDKRTFQNTVLAVDDMVARVNRDTNFTTFMQHVSTDAGERALSEAAQEEVSSWMIDMTKREDLYKAIKTFADSPAAARLTGTQARLLSFAIRDYKRDGMALPAETRKKLTEIQKEISKLGIDFERNIREDETVVLCSKDDLKGMPDEFLAQLKRIGPEGTSQMFAVGMAYPIYTPIMEHCDVEATRERVWLQYKRRAGSKNVAVLERILQLRAEQAKMLGYNSVADYETEVLMSKSAKNVADFYAKLRPLVLKKSTLDFEDLRDAKRAHTDDGNAVFQPWDFMYYKTRLLKEKYAVDPEVVRQYFPMQSVVDGLFSVTQSMYGLIYKEITDSARASGRPMWHTDVRLFEVYDKKTNKLLGEFYIDLFPRDNKYSHAAQWGLRERKTYADGSKDLPLAALVCNFTKPTADKPSLLDHEEVETFFHEFGHCLHTILTEADVARFAGTSVERDFVEAPSQMFENWVWSAEVLNTFAKHYKTHEPFPKALLDGMLAAKNLGSGIDAEQQFYYGMTDQMYHSARDGKINTTKIAEDLYGQVTRYKPVPGTFYQASFGHLVGYQAGYYGYMWSLVYASDMFTRFKEKGLLNPEAGMYYRSKILSRGGTMDGLDMVRDYLGREPDMKAFLEHLGLKAEK